MSINLKLFLGTAAIAGIALGTFVHVQSSQDTARRLTQQVFSGGIQPIVALEQAYGLLSGMEARYASANAERAHGAELVTGLAGVLSALGEADSSLPRNGPSSQAIGDLRYAVSRLKAAEGEVSGRFLTRELGVIATSLSQTLSILRAETRIMGDEADLGLAVAERSHVAGLFALLLALTLFAWAISSDVTSRVRRAVGALRAIEAGEGAGEPPPAPRRSPPFRDLFGTISGLGAKLEQDRREEELARSAMDARLEQEVERLEKQFQVTIDKMQEGYCLLDENLDLVSANEPFRRLFAGLKPGASAQDLIAEPVLEPALTARAPGVHVHETKEGRVVEVRRHAASGRSTLITVQDITDRHVADRTIERLSGSDALTGLPSRTRFYDHLGTVLSGRNLATGVSVLCLDIQGFQDINAVHGGIVGDGVLRGAAERLGRLVGEGDFLARTGADEFAILQSRSGGPAISQVLADAILEAFEAPLVVESLSVNARMAIGMVHLEPRGRRPALDPHAVMGDAELALASARAEKRGGAHLFSEAIRRQAEERRELETDLRQALAKDQFELHYQPFADVRRGTVSGFEALIRWHHPQRGAVPPSRFIPVAEETGLIDEIGAWVLEEACRAAAQWPAHLIVSVNLSAIQFRSPQIVENIERTIRGSGLAPERLQLEVTESVFLDDVEETLTRLSALRALGVTLSMDDFGTGYSSLGYLSRFPFDKLKIDQGFVRDMNKPENTAIIRAVVGLSSSMRIGVIAEGVETREQFEALREEGCAEMQGYFFGRPAPASQLARHLARINGAFASGALLRAGIPANSSRSA